ncbi:adenylylsulfate reductase subunit B [Clostridium acetobutylicum]|uniref:Ferredoxin n=1 Tax=Clostridium acetobutylicum (strain ATCC 824 / DSM 792 / JCM 1419 / IAM 19013 / LMG 5710 / NBRC 13948 / NRRL B-527 / VKM B-1787 / 2291 / W) TaxID=272562 RepID=Q97MT6_CLOAB|nr:MULTISPECIES: ferredoxin family protein [Clostridium]AAK78090.1 Ferredoxin [Clostridium acetobutylicum ATCC 824]ADZ19149.1 Ferredoxin [Clostridium acetobutylicum EA 2018]AEI31062.1 ferredoxin [Clostridium acetobutylicum DSM 1731]AWV81847.1 ferredoxin family protein [Clostridium acetobutylicum]MBC2395395.1 ferredoxin family protein [Clostridium acetobutylicum]
MSIKIDLNKCVGCQKCINICPGSLIDKNNDGKAYIKYPKDCWGCTACLKECKFKAIKYFLGADIGGNGSYMYVSEKGEELEWHMINEDGKEKIITTSRKESNKY